MIFFINKDALFSWENQFRFTFLQFGLCWQTAEGGRRKLAFSALQEN
jgi:hypothetical protein